MDRWIASKIDRKKDREREKQETSSINQKSV